MGKLAGKAFIKWTKVDGACKPTLLKVCEEMSEDGLLKCINVETQEELEIDVKNIQEAPSF